MRLESGERLERAGRSLVSLASLRPDVTFTVDEVGLAVRLVAAQTVLGQSRIDLSRTQRPPELLHREPASAYLNWAISGDTEQRRAASTELGVAVGPGLLLSGTTADRELGVVRGLTTGYWDDRERLVRWAAGDFVLSPGDALGGTGLALGGSVGREFSLDPYLVRLPYPRTSVFSPTPATLEVWVDDGLVRRTQVAPGTIDLENVPVNAGLSQVRTVLRDPFGRESSASTFALLGSSTLAPGLVDWGAAAGVRRRDYGTRSFDYGGGPLAQARLRAGITDLLTLGGRVEAGDRLVSGGGSLALATRLAEIEATGAASLDGGDAGAAAYLTLRRVGRRGALVGQLRWDTGRYANASLASEADRALLRGVLTGSWALSARLTVLGELAGERRRDLGHDGRGVVRVTYALPPGWYVSASLAAHASRTSRRRRPRSSSRSRSRSRVAPPPRSRAGPARAAPRSTARRP